MMSLIPVSVQAQEPDDNKLFFTIFGGFTTGTGDIWNIGAQRVGVLSNSGAEVGVDTFALNRSERPGLALGISATYFPDERLGYSFELSLFNPGLDTECSMSFDSRPASQFNANRGYCESIGRRGDSMGTVNITASAVYRLLPHSAAKPYLRLIAGVADMGSGTTEVVGAFGTTERVLIGDRGAGFQPTAGAGLGLFLPTSGGYGIRFEVRDQLYRVRALGGPADGLGQASSVMSWVHHPTVLMGFDIVLERKRGRRY